MYKHGFEQGPIRERSGKTYGGKSIMSTPVLGIDIAMRKFDAVLLAEAGPRHKVFGNHAAGFAELVAWMRSHGVLSVHACMEATGRYGEDLAYFLFNAGQTVSVVNPARIKAFAMSELTRTKTDKADAGVIARFCLHQQPRAWRPMNPEIRELQALVRHLDGLRKTRQALRNRIHARVPSVTVVESLDRVIATISDEMKKTNAAIRAHFKRYAPLRAKRDLLVTVPGIGPITAAKILAEVPEIESFEGARQVAAYAGLTPKEHISGSSVRGRTRLSKIGNARIRTALYMPAVVSIRCNPLVRALAERLRAKG